MNEEKEFRLRFSSLLTLFGTLVIVIITIAWFVAYDVFRLEAIYAIIIAAGIGLIASLIASVWQEHILTRPTVLLANAILHLKEDQAKSGAPDHTRSKIGGKYIKDLIEMVYGLATATHEANADTESKKLYVSAVLDSAPLGVFVFDSDGNLAMANEKGKSYLDIDYKEAVGQHRAKVLPLTFQTDQSLEDWLDLSKQNQIKADSFWERVNLVRVDSSRIIFDVIAHYSKEDSNGIETILVLHDRTGEYTADESEMDFVALAAHELRGPITVIRGYLDVFEDEMKDVFTVEQRGLLQKATVASEQLSGTVNNILNVARIDQEHMELHIREGDWRETLTNAYEELKIRAQVYGRILKLELPAELPPVAVDRASIMEVISNLVDNAIKYSPEGGEVVIRAEAKENFISTTVQDNGIGIPQAVVGNLFKKFYRSHRSRQAVTGTGLGLYLTKVIVDSHGGNIWVRSTEGQGATFGFELPTYESVAAALKRGNNDGKGIKRSSHGWIKNHSMYRR